MEGLRERGGGRKRRREGWREEGREGGKEARREEGREGGRSKKGIEGGKLHSTTAVSITLWPFRSLWCQYSGTDTQTNRETHTHRPSNVIYATQTLRVDYHKQDAVYYNTSREWEKSYMHTMQTVYHCRPLGQNCPD